MVDFLISSRFGTVRLPQLQLVSGYNATYWGYPTKTTDRMLLFPTRNKCTTHRPGIVYAAQPQVFHIVSLRLGGLVTVE